VIAYLDASVVLRLVLVEEHRLPEWDQVEAAVASALTEVECLRTLDRLARMGRLSPDELAERRGAVYQLLAAVDLIDVSRIVLRRAADPFPTPLGTLDAIHLSTALLAARLVALSCTASPDPSAGSSAPGSPCSQCRARP
jgi:predicted nucleic acid-binding protein